MRKIFFRHIVAPRQKVIGTVKFGHTAKPIHLIGNLNGGNLISIPRGNFSKTLFQLLFNGINRSILQPIWKMPVIRKCMLARLNTVCKAKIHTKIGGRTAIDNGAILFITQLSLLGLKCIPIKRNRTHIKGLFKQLLVALVPFGGLKSLQHEEVPTITKSMTRLLYSDLGTTKRSPLLIGHRKRSISFAIVFDALVTTSIKFLLTCIKSCKHIFLTRHISTPFKSSDKHLASGLPFS